MGKLHQKLCRRPRDSRYAWHGTAGSSRFAEILCFLGIYYTGCRRCYRRSILGKIQDYYRWMYVLHPRRNRPSVDITSTEIYFHKRSYWRIYRGNHRHRTWHGRFRLPKFWKLRQRYQIQRQRARCRTMYRYNSIPQASWKRTSHCRSGGHGATHLHVVLLGNQPRFSRGNSHRLTRTQRWLLVILFAAAMCLHHCPPSRSSRPTILYPSQTAGEYYPRLLQSECHCFQKWMEIGRRETESVSQREMGRSVH